MSHSNAAAVRSSDLDMTDVNTQNALDALKQQDNLARRSSVRRANTLHSDGNSPVTPPRRHPTLIRRNNDGVPPPPPIVSPQQRLCHSATTSNAVEEKEKQRVERKGDYATWKKARDSETPQGIFVGGEDVL
ncbi:hypothetical protein BDB00DRAFT_811696 [Zychaea mexicana]|uniref:uncharacterized protein n=1 Tax=Zychaea mexicana TaxID=64656 RepID=UPI0022FE2835|nr:uncharacterized protein BDB00DRAFT_811696 [Zychaea mexicana]KAI9495782.1 hypothetical protein BDB00DRAFT_811696 [Zychaea mexicana]